MEEFDIVASLGPVAAAVALIVGGSTVAGFVVWQLGLGIDVGLKKFGKLVRRS